MKKKAVIVTLCAILCAGMIAGQALMASAAGAEPPPSDSGVSEGLVPEGGAGPVPPAAGPDTGPSSQNPASSADSTTESASPASGPASQSTSEPYSGPDSDSSSESVSDSPGAPPPEAPASPGPSSDSPSPESSSPEAPAPVIEYTVTYTLRQGDSGELSFASAVVEAGAAIGADNVPALTLPEGWELLCFAIANTEYPAEGLAAYVPASDVAVEVRTVESEDKDEPVLDPNAPIEDDAGGDEAYWETPPEWAGSGQALMRGNLVTAAAMRAAHTGLEDRIAFVAETLRLSGEYPIETGEDNFHEALAVYAIRHGQTENYPYGVAINSEKDGAELQSIYWSMNAVNAAKTADGSVIRVSRLSGADVFGLAGAAKTSFDALTVGDGKARVQALMQNSILGRLSAAEHADIAAAIPGGLSAGRRAVLMAALSLESKVGYFWGGKSAAVGWDDSWGQSMTVTAEGDGSTGTDRPFGLDGSGFVSWAFIAANGGGEALPYIGNGTANQYRNSRAVGWNEARPGDLVFYKNPAAVGASHVGIVLSVDANGAPARIIHCSSGANGVTVSGAEGFAGVRRPFIYGE